MTQILIDALPKDSTTFVYGRLSKEAARVAPIDLIYFGKRLEGFLVAGKTPSAWINLDRLPAALLKLRAASKAVLPALVPGGTPGGAGPGWASSKFEDTDLDGVWEAFKTMYTQTGFTDRKLRIRMDRGCGGAAAQDEV